MKIYGKLFETITTFKNICALGPLCNALCAYNLKNIIEVQESPNQYAPYRKCALRFMTGYKEIIQQYSREEAQHKKQHPTAMCKLN